MLRRSNGIVKDGNQLPGTLPVLPLPYGSALLPGGTLSLQLSRRDNTALLQHILSEADRIKSTLFLAAAPLRVQSQTKGSDSQTISQDSSSKNRMVKKTRPSSLLQVLKIPSDGADGQVVDDPDQPSVQDINEYACAARITRVERVSKSYTVDEVQHIQQSYLISLEGICRLRIDRFTQTGTPFFEAQVSSFPELRASEDDQPISQELSDSLLDIANKILDTLSAPSSPGGGNGSRNATLPMPSQQLSAIALKRLRAQLRNYSPSTAAELCDILLSSLLPASRAASYPAKVHHLALLDPSERVAHALAQLRTLKTELESREAVGTRYVGNVQRRTREMVLRGLMEAIRQELIALKRQEGRDNGMGDDDDDGPRGSPTTVRVVRGNGNGRGSGEAGQDEEEEEEDELVVLERKIHDSSMPDDARLVAVRELKRLKSIPPQSIEHGGIRNYLDWLTDLPWGTSSYDLVEGQEGKAVIDKDFLEKARKQLDNDHFGIDRVKERLLQYLAILRLRNEKWEVEERLRIKAEQEEDAKQQKQQQLPLQDAEGNELEGRNDKALVKYDKSKNAGGKTERPTSPNGKVVPRKHKPKPIRKDKGPILLLVGPPGVGKTSIAKSLASALGRPYHRISLGGVRDEAEIRGFRRTYVGSQPGVFVQALRKVKVNNPVFLLDEIDKLTSGAGFHGDPSAAMLEVLDPEQNFSFNDHYINTPVDLSSVLFIATANNLSTIPPPLLDRMEVIHLSGYVDLEKLQIARRYLLPKQIQANQLTPEHIEIGDDVILDVINQYCSGESGVRTLERQIGSIVRWKAVEFAKARDSYASADRPSFDTVSLDGYQPRVGKEDLEKILGSEYYEHEKIEQDEDKRPGVATGLAYTGSGNGDIMRIEVTSFPGHGSLRLTGSLGEVISESSELGLSWVRTNAYELGLTAEKRDDIMKDLDLHLHIPAGSIRKEGPSAGVAIVLAMVSLFSGHALDSTLAMTGEITLRGKVTPVGGIKEKVLAAHRAGIKRVILPIRNRKDIVADLPQRIKDDIEISYVEDIWQALDIAFGDRLWHEPPAVPTRRRRHVGGHSDSKL